MSLKAVASVPGGGGGGGVTSVQGESGAITLTSAGGTVAITTPTGSTINLEAASGTGDVAGPASSTDNAIARFDGTTGKIIQNSAATIADTSGNITAGTYNGNTIGAGSTSGTNTGDQTNITGNAATATALQTGRTISITGDLAYTSPSFDGTANITAAGTLATVNSNVGAFGSATQVAVPTVNGKGLITAISNTSIQIAESQVTNLTTDLAAKQSTTLTSAHLLVGNVSNVATDVAASGDLTLANNGAFTFNTVNANVGTFGSATQVAQITANAKGLATAVANVTITPAASSITGGAALTKTDDTNVTLTLGGTPTTALLVAASLTLGWTGLLAASRGGTNNGFTQFSGPATSTKTFTLPNASDTIACLGTAQTWTASQTFNTNVKNLFGTTTPIGSIYSDGSFLIVNPIESGSAALSIGPPSASGGTGNLVCNQLGVGGTAIGGTTIINYNGTSTARSILGFTLTATTAAATATAITNTTVDQGSSASFTLIGIDNSLTLKTTSHTTYTQTGVSAKCGIDATIVIASGTYTIHGARLTVASTGVGNASTSSGTFRRYGVFQDAITAIAGTPASDLIMGSFWNNSMNFVVNIPIIFDSTATALGDTTLQYVSANTDLELVVDGTAAQKWSSTTSTMSIDLTMADAKNIILNATTGTKIGTATTQKLGFYNKAPVVQPTDGATLTNSVTSGGTTDTIANYTDLVIYANDAAAIRNDIYQLARKVKIITDNLRLLGLES